MAQEPPTELWDPVRALDLQEPDPRSRHLCRHRACQCLSAKCPAAISLNQATENPPSLWCSSAANFRADHFTRDDDLHPPVLLAPLRRIVAGHGIRRSKTLRCDSSRVETLLDKIIAYGVRPLHGQRMIDRGRSRLIRVTFHGEIGAGVRQHDTR